MLCFTYFSIPVFLYENIETSACLTHENFMTLEIHKHKIIHTNDCFLSLFIMLTLLPLLSHYSVTCSIQQAILN